MPPRRSSCPFAYPLLHGGAVPLLLDVLGALHCASEGEKTPWLAAIFVIHCC